MRISNLTQIIYMCVCVCVCVCVSHIYIMAITQPCKRMKFCHLQQQGWQNSIEYYAKLNNSKKNTLCCHLYVEPKNKTKPKQKQTHRYREQTSGYKSREGRGEGQIRGMRLRDTYSFILYV